MDRRGLHLDGAERAVIFAEHRRGTSQREIARLLGRSASTICRELGRGRVAAGTAVGAGSGYCPQAGQRAYARRRLRCRPRRKLRPGGALWRFVWHHLVTFRWSPEQIAATLRSMHPDDPRARVSHETIYAMIYAQPRGGLKAALVEALRQGKHRRGRGRGIGRRPGGGSAIVPETLRILHRPEEVDARLVPGHWEGDLLKGASNRSCVGTLVERKTRFVTLAKMDGNGAAAVLEGFTRQMKHLPAFLRRSLTYDRGSEMACHPELARRLKIDIWFCDPHSPWQRGSNENTNGLLRQFLPKGADLRQFSQRDLDHIAKLMNNRPRKTLGWKTPAQALAEELEKTPTTVALGT
jgi:IS30 family transposase